MHTTLLVLAQAGLGTGGIRNWILQNLVPLLLLVVALLVLWIGAGQGDNSAVMKRVVGVFAALALVGFAVNGSGVDIGTFLAGLFSNKG